MISEEDPLEVDAETFNLVSDRRSSLFVDKWKRVSLQLSRIIVPEEETPSESLHSLNNAGVLEAYKNLEARLKRIKVENLVFLRFLKENDPEAVEEVEAAAAPGNRERMSILSSRRSSVLSKTLSFRSVATSGMASRNKERIVNVAQKSELIMRDLEMVQAKLDKLKKNFGTTRRSLVAQLEEIESRREELEDSIQNFENFRCSYEQVSLEKFVRFMEDWSKKSRLMADKIRLRFSSVKVQYHKLTGILAHKQLIGENLQEIDFENLRIENLHLVAKIEMRMQHLYELKKMTGANNLKLSQLKTALEHQIQQKQVVSDGIKLMETELTKGDEEIMKVEPELDQVKDEYERVKEKVCKYKAPEILEYVHHKVKVNNLKKELKMWNRRKLIRATALDIEICEMKKLLRCRQPHPCWFE